MKILLNINFVGSAYCGYQVQKNGISIQQRLNEAAYALFGFECDITGCSRTDRGVHANMFCACVSEKGGTGISCTIPEDKIPIAFNSLLPGDICVQSAAYVPDGFHPRYDVKYKEYIYKILNTPLPDPFMYGRVWHIPGPITQHDRARMRRAAGFFVGEHDFSAYMASGSSVSDTVRRVMYADVESDGENMIIFRVAADGFLYNMVRIMTGTLVAVAQGKLEPEDIPSVTASLDRARAGITAPPDGLYLNRIVYR
ncbi:MAG: tRNA pseudouridine synthase A [Eubacteriales bacterium]